MSDTNKTKYFYKEKELDDHKELDYLDTELVHMNLNTVDTFIVTAPFEYRPDLISMKVFGDYHYGWLLCLHNDVLDPVFHFEKGVSVNIPSIDQYFRYFNRNTYSRPRNRRV